MRCRRCHAENASETRFCGQCGAPFGQAPDTPPFSTLTSAAPVVRELEIGTTFARRYQVIEELGRGGMGRVYKVYDTEVREKLALKLLHPEVAADGPTIERFRNELKLARTISHRNICRMHDLGREGDANYITMEYVPGEDLKSFIHRVGALPLGKAVSIARQVGSGLAEAHRAGVVHRDLKPQNIMVDRDGNARIMDFGIARSVRSKGITGANMMIGTPEYMSPEQVDGKEADGRSDIYSLGAVLFEMLTGRAPFEAETPLAVAVKHKTDPAPDPSRTNPQVPDGLKRIVLKCLAKTREERYQSVDDLDADLARVEQALPQTTQPLPIRRPATSRQVTVRLPPKKIWVPATVVLIALAALAVWQVLPERQGSKRSIAVLGFRNQTGDPSFDYLQETIPNLLITSLEQSGHFRVTTWQRLRDLLRQAGREGSAALDEEAGFEVCRREGIEALAVGFFTKAGETFVTDVKVLDAATKQPLKTAQARGEGAASILKTQIDDISRSVARGIGLPPLKIERAQPKVAEITTGSIEAYNLYLRGRDLQERFYAADARKTLEKAVALDPEFAAAWLVLSDACNELSDRKARDQALEKAKQFSDRATEKDRLRIEARHASLIEHNQGKRLRFLRELAEKYPAEKYAHSDLGSYYQGARLYPEALAEFEKAVALDPEFGHAINELAYIHVKMGSPDKALPFLERYAAVNPGDPNPKDSLAEFYMRMGRLDDAAAKYKEVLTAKPDFHLSWASLAYINALKEDYGETNRCLEEMIARAPTPTTRNEALWWKAYFLYLQGRCEEALKIYSAQREAALKAGVEYAVATMNWITGFIRADRGDYEAARRDFEAFCAWNDKITAQNPASAPGLIRNFFAGWVGLRQGRPEAGRAALKAMEPELGSPDPATEERSNFLFYLLVGETALAEGRAEEAIAAAGKIPVRIIPNLRTAGMANYNQPFLKDVLARAYWKKGELGKAAAEYRKLMTFDPANQVRYLIHPLYHYRMGRVLEEKGDRTGARAEYVKFLEGWRDADPTHPELADVRRRLAVP